MFNCQICKTTSRPGEKSVRVVVETRTIDTPPRTEIVREKVACVPCATVMPSATDGSVAQALRASLAESAEA